MHRTAHALLTAVLLLAVTGEAQATRPGPKPGTYASTRLRDARGRFVPVKPYQANGWANPASTGQSRVHVTVHPATRSVPGSIRVEIPEHYRGASYKGGTQARSLFVPNGKKPVNVIHGQLLVRPGSRYSSFSSATYRGAIPAGTPVPHDALRQALQSLQVNPHGLEFGPASPGR